MTPQRFSTVFENLAARSEQSEGWVVAVSLTQARIGAFDCDVVIRARLNTRSVRGAPRLNGDLRVSLLNVGGVDTARGAAELRFVMLDDGVDRALPLYVATLAAARMHLLHNPAFLALWEREQLQLLVPAAPKAASPPKRL